MSFRNVEDKRTEIYSVFPACGKTWLYEHQEEYGLRILDSDSSEFSWIEYPVPSKDGEIGNETIKLRNPDFPNNYIKYIKENIGKYDYIFVSSHASVRKELDKEGINFTIVYPGYGYKAEWVGRCFIREQNGESGCGAKAMYDNFLQWHVECFATGLYHREIVLKSNEYLSDHFERL